MSKRYCAFILLIILPVFAFPQTDDSGAYTLRIDFPLFDLPYQINATEAMGHGFFGSYASLSMSQSLAVSVDLYSAMHFGMRKLYDHLALEPVWKNTIYIGGTAAGILTFAYLLPFGYPWMHIEYHRSVLSRFEYHNVNTWYWYNGWYIQDGDLVQLKADHPSDAVRLYSAGAEGYVLFADQMLRNKFFYDLKNLSAFTAFFSLYFGAFNIAGVAFADKFAKDYGLVSLLNLDIDKKIIKSFEDEREQHSRFLYGFPAINWVYDLFRPNEPYAARGPHPSGNGIARYITLAQLSDEEYAYLVKQGWLSYLNFVAPLLYGFNSFPLGNTGYDWNAALRHYLTSFGTDSPVQFLLKNSPFNMIFTWHNYMNYANYYPAIEAELRDFPLTIGGFTTYLSPRLLIGVQPKDQVFKTGEAEFLGLIGLRADFAVSKHVLPYFELTAKTDGWVAGNEYLDRSVSCVLGVSARF